MPMASMVLAALLGLGLAEGQSAEPRAADEALIRAVIEEVHRGFADFDAAKIAAAYSIDADWTNAFGVTRHGRAEIEQFLKKLFTRAEFRSSREPQAPDVSIRFLRPDVAVVRTQFKRVGQKSMATGAEMAERRIHVLRVMSKQNGHWLIASELIMDERADER